MERGQGNLSMKRIIILISLLMVSCTKQPPSDTVNQVPLNEIFEHSERCPHLCWMNIKPGVTTMEEAAALLLASDQIDQQSIKNTEYGIAVKWYMGATDTTFTTWVKIYVNNNDKNVKSITFVNLHTYTVGDFIELLGEPDEISIAVRDAPDARYLKYALYYTSLNTFFYTSTEGKMIGPDPEDSIADMYLDTNLDADNLYPWIIRDNNRNRQPWLGYGHLDEYLPGVMPTSTIQSPP